MKTTLITGTTSGIGKAFAEKFANMGNNIILVSRNEEKLKYSAIQICSDEARKRSRNSLPQIDERETVSCSGHI